MALDTHVVHTDLNYLIPDGFESAPKSVKVRDARRMPKESWQTLGFELFHFPSVVKNWDDDHAIAQLHYKELVEFAIELGRRRLERCVRVHLGVSPLNRCFTVGLGCRL